MADTEKLSTIHLLSLLSAEELALFAQAVLYSRKTRQQGNYTLGSNRTGCFTKNSLRARAATGFF